MRSKKIASLRDAMYLAFYFGRQVDRSGACDMLPMEDG